MYHFPRIGPGKYDFKIDLKGNGTLKKPPPYGIQMYKGYKNVALTRKTANFVTHHPIAKAFRKWLADTLIPDESYYATLGRINQLDLEPGKYEITRKYPLCRYILGVLTHITALDRHLEGNKTLK